VHNESLFDKLVVIINKLFKVIVTLLLSVASHKNLLDLIYLKLSDPT